MEFFQSIGKGKPVAAIVEAVANGGVLRLTLLPSLTPASVNVAGVQCPSFKRVAADAAAAAAAASAAATPASNGEAAPADPAAPAQAAVQPEPYAREAKYFTESRTLNREVRVVLEGVDKYNNLFGSVFYPEGDRPANLAEQLMQAGYCKVREQAGVT